MSLFDDANQISDGRTIVMKGKPLSKGSWWRFSRRPLETLEESEHYQAMLVDLADDPLKEAKAFLTCRSREWGGSDFALETDFRGPDRQPHPLAGQAPPTTLEWIRKLPTPIIAATVEWLNTKDGEGAQRSPEAEKEFLGSDRDPRPSPDDGSGSDQAPAASGA